jgi:hypothetical protein
VGDFAPVEGAQVILDRRLGVRLFGHFNDRKPEGIRILLALTNLYDADFDLVGRRFMALDLDEVRL